MKRVFSTGAVAALTTAALGLASAASGASIAHSAGPSTARQSGWRYNAVAASAASTDDEIAGYVWTHPDHSRLSNWRMTADWVQPRVIAHGYHAKSAEIKAGFTDWRGNLIGAQAGVDMASYGSKIVYRAWYSTGDAFHWIWRQFRISIRPGDHMSLAVRVHGPASDHFTIRLTDVRPRGNRKPVTWTGTAHLTDPLQAPGGIFIGTGPTITHGSRSPLVRFTPVHFTHVDNNGYPIGSYEADGLTQYDYALVGASGHEHVLAAPSALGSNGDSFTITWKRSYTY